MNDKHTNNGQGELPAEKASVEERTMAMVTAYALDQVTEVERQAVEDLLATSPKLRQHVDSIRQLGGLLRSSAEEKTEGSPSLRSVLTQKLESSTPPAVPPPPPKSLKDSEVVHKSPSESDRRRWWAWVAGGVVAASFGGGYLLGKLDFSPRPIEMVQADILGIEQRNNSVRPTKKLLLPPSDGFPTDDAPSHAYGASTFSESNKALSDKSGQKYVVQEEDEENLGLRASSVAGPSNATTTSTGTTVQLPTFLPGGGATTTTAPLADNSGSMGAMGGMPGGPGMMGQAPGQSPAGAAGMGPGVAPGMMGGNAGAARPFRQSGGSQGDGVASGKGRWKFGWTAEEGGQRAANGYLFHDDVRQHAVSEDPSSLYSEAGIGKHRERFQQDEKSGEQYETYVENSYFNVKDVPLSTFAIDVDTASYANVRRFLNNNQLPPPTSIRVEELLNYFTYSYPGPTDSRPFAVHLEAAQCPWNQEHKLVRVGLKGKEIHKAERPSSNLVFLIDTSGSMQDEDKLPLLKSSLTMLTRELTAKDRVTIVTYAGSAGLVLPPTSGNDKDKIIATLDQLLAGGSTHGSAGITLAYEQAKANFIQEGTNRVILCTDGDLNVGVTSDDALVELIKDRAKTGVYLSVMGFGTGNLKDGKLEKLADHGNGVYAYIDGLKEARKVFVEQMSGSLVTIAKDVKIQLEFNPKQVQAYRLVGYENRVMENKDFRNDKKDAGEIGAGHTVTALYEIVPAGVSLTPPVKLRYQPVAEGRSATSPASGGVADDISKELLTVRLRYKNPEATENDPATEFETSLANPGATIREASENFRFASAVAMAGLVLRNSQFRGDSNLDAAIEIASTALGEDPQGWRAEFIDLLRRAKGLQGH